MKISRMYQTTVGLLIHLTTDVPSVRMYQIWWKSMKIHENQGNLIHSIFIRPLRERRTCVHVRAETIHTSSMMSHATNFIASSDREPLWSQVFSREETRFENLRSSVTDSLPLHPMCVPMSKPWRWDKRCHKTYRQHPSRVTTLLPW